VPVQVRPSAPANLEAAIETVAAFFLFDPRILENIELRIARIHYNIAIF